MRRTGAETWHLREKGDVVYVIRLYPEEREAEEKLLIPIRENPRISMVDTKKEAEWKMTEEGIQVVIPKSIVRRDADCDCMEDRTVIIIQ